MKLTLVVISFCITLFAQAQACEAWFSLDVNAYENSRQIHFRGGHIQSLGNTSSTVYWSFGDGSTSTVANPSHTYAQNGIYDVCVIYTEQSGGFVVCSDTFCQSISVSDNPDCGIYLSTDNNAGRDVSFNFDNENFDHYLFDFGDGSYWIGQPDILTGMEVYHNYEVADTFTACVTAYSYNNLGQVECMAYMCTEAIAQDTSDFIADFSFTISGNQASFSNLSNAAGHTAHWNFGDGDTSTQNNPTHTYANPGTYLVRLDIVQNIGGNFYSSDHLIDTVIIGTPAPQCKSFFSFHNTSAASFEFHNFSYHNTNTQYNWDFGDGTSSTQRFPLKTYASPGIYNVCLESTQIDNNGNILCTNSSCLKVEVISQPTIPCQADFKAKPVGIDSIFTIYLENHSSGNTYSSFWDFGNGDYDSIANPTAGYQSTGNYNVCLTIIDDSGCFDTHCENTSVTQCSDYFQFYYNTEAYNNEIFFNPWGFFLNPFAEYIIDYGDGTIDTFSSSNPSNYLHVYHTVGTYNVCLTSSVDVWGCSYTYCDSVEVRFIRKRRLDGNVFASGSNLTVGTVYAIKLVGNSLIAVDSTEFAYSYTFTTLDTGQYLLKAVLDSRSPDYLNHLPTYYGDTLFWDGADVLDFYQDTLGIDINLVAGTNLGGPGFVGGNVYQGANKTSAVGDPVPHVQVMLLNMDNSGVQYTFTDANGNYTFSNIAFGTYQVYTEVVGKTTYPQTVTIDDEHTTFENINIVVTDDAIYASASSATSISLKVKIYPNPVQSKLTVEYVIVNPELINIEVVNVFGEIVASQKQATVAGINSTQLDWHSFPSGIYFVVITNQNDEKAVYRIMKY